MAFIDEVRDRFGVEPICRVLTQHGVKIAPSGYYAFKTRPVSARALRDGELVLEIRRLFWDREKGRGITGVRKMWHLLQREGIVRGALHRRTAHAAGGSARGASREAVRHDPSG